MPTRYLKPGICDSKHIDKLSPDAEVTYYRLLVNVDDFGRYDARPLMVKSHLYPLKESYTTNKIEKLLIELAKSGLIAVYETEGDRYLQILRWDNKPRALQSKFPAFDGDCIQMYTDVPLTETVNRKPITETVNRITSSEVSDVFLFWQTTLNHPRALLDAKRTKLIKDALKSGRTVDDIKLAIKGCSLTPHNMGDNDRGEKYNDFHVILKDAANIERFMNNAVNPPKKKSGGVPRDDFANQDYNKRF